MSGSVHREVSPYYAGGCAFAYKVGGRKSYGNLGGKRIHGCVEVRRNGGLFRWKRKIVVRIKERRLIFILGGVRNEAACLVEARTGSCCFRRSKECGCVFIRSQERKLWF